jgi:hypothetical protein
MTTHIKAHMETSLSQSSSIASFKIILFDESTLSYGPLFHEYLNGILFDVGESLSPPIPYHIYLN